MECPIKTTQKPASVDVEPSLPWRSGGSGSPRGNAGTDTGTPSGGRCTNSAWRQSGKAA